MKTGSQLKQRTPLRAKTGFKRPLVPKHPKVRTPLKKKRSGQKRAKSSVPKPKKKSIKSLKRKLDEIYSIYIRRSAADDRGEVSCYCGARIPWQLADNSHYIPRGCLSLRYEPKNTHPSCRRCNRFMGGNLQAYSIFLEQTYGAGILQWLDGEKRKTAYNFPFQEKLSEYQAKLAALQ